MNFISYLFSPFNIILVVLLIVLYYFANREYKKSSYYQVTHHSFIATRLNIGRNGEYLTYKCLKRYEAEGAKFLFNVYVPKANGETSEIDVMMIHHKGIFVLESKNYSGWIFGNETKKMWTQTLPAGRGRSRKESFYNPIMQNQSHIKHLKEFLGKPIQAWSVIVFSERCTLKKVQLKSNDIYVIKRNRVARTVKNICKSIPNELLSDTDIIDIYNCLYPFTQVDSTVKEEHIKNIQAKMGKQEKQKEEPVEVVPESNVPACPLCGNELNLRIANKGEHIGKQFYVCSKYPECKYLKLR